MTKPVMLCIGSASQDVFLAGAVLTPECSHGVCYEHLKLGDKLSVDSLTFATGGNAMNASVTFARQGLETHFISLIGDDPAGQAVLNDLDNENINTKYVISDPGFTTSYSVILLAPNGERTILNYHGEPLSSREENFHGEEISGNWLYISSVGSMSLLIKIMKEAFSKKMKIAFNPASYELKYIEECKYLFQYIELLALNKEEAQMFVAGKTAKDLVVELSKSVKYVLVSDGPQGSVATDGIQVVEAGMYKDVPVLDRTGAGDSFTSGFVSQIALGNSLESAITFASANSTSVVTKIGAKSGILKYGTKIDKMPLTISSI